VYQREQLTNNSRLDEKISSDPRLRVHGRIGARGFFERLHNNIDEGVRELCARKPDLCKKLEASQKQKAEATPMNSVQTDQVDQRSREK
jgi:hypothetical protein